MAWGHDIVRLQAIDLERTRINIRRTVVKQEMTEDAGIAMAKAELQRNQQHVDGIRKHQSELEFELGKIQSKSRLTQEKLYSGRITNSRELQDLQSEGIALKRRDSELEDQILEVMMAREEAEHLSDAAQKTLDTLQLSLTTHHAVLAKELAELEAQDQSLSQERDKLVQALPAAILDTYTYLRSRTGNRPVAVLNGRQCSVCGVDVSPSNVQKARHNEEAYCGGCRRLIVNLD